MKRSFVREILDSIDERTISFAGGLPDSRLFPEQQIKEIIASENLQKSLQYMSARGDIGLREKLAQKLTHEELISDAKDILITSGAQQAISLIAKIFQKSHLIVELPTYLGAIPVFQQNEMSIESVLLEEDGMNVEALESVITKDSLIYIMSDFQNPTGRRYSIEKRKAIAKVIQNSGATLLEDSAYSDLYFDEKYPSIASMCPENTIYIGSFSKVFAPGLRVGYVRAKKEILEKLLILKEGLDLHTSGFSQMVINGFWQRGLLENHVKSIREAYQNRCDSFCSNIKEQLPHFQFSTPKGGMFLYGRFEEVDTKKLVVKCMERGAVFVPGGEFYLEKPDSSEARFNFTNATDEQIIRGLSIIQEALSA